MSRYVIYGAGAVGCVLGGRLALANLDVVLVARGAQADALAQGGLRLRSKLGEERIRIPVVKTIAEVGLRHGDIVVLTMKTHDALQAIDELALVAGTQTPIVCAQNGLESERMALRLFENVYGAYVYFPAASLEPGVASYYSHPVVGVLDVGRLPNGVDELAEAITADLCSAGFDAVAQPDIMRWKRGKLVSNMSNAVSAACERLNEAEDILSAARSEAIDCFAALALEFAGGEEIRTRGSKLISCQVDGVDFPGGSTFQSLARGTGATESDYLSGEIVFCGRMAGVATPVNLALQNLLRDMARTGAAPRSYASPALRKLIWGREP